MNRRFLVAGAILGGLTLFVWRSLANAAVPWPGPPVQGFRGNGSAQVELIDAIRPYAAGNGIYYSSYGVFAVMSVLPDRSDKAAGIGSRLAGELALDMVVALALAALLQAITCSAVLERAGVLALAGLAAALVTYGSDTIGYGFPLAYAFARAMELVVGFFLAGLVLAWLAQRMSPTES